MAKDLGVTLFELLICLSIFAVIAFYVSPFPIYFYKDKELEVITEEIKEAVQFAKFESILRGERLILLSINNNDWSSGMRLYSAVKDFKTNKVDKKLIREWQWKNFNGVITWKGFQSEKYLIFMPQISQCAINGNFIVEILKQKKIVLTVNRLGRIEIKKISV